MSSSFSVFIVVALLLCIAAADAAKLLSSTSIKNINSNLQFMTCNSTTVVPPNFCSPARCWWTQPYYCYKSNGEALCLDENEAKRWDVHRCEVCYDLRQCATPACQEQCSEQFCQLAGSMNQQCPNSGGGGDGDATFMCEKGTVQFWCGRAEACHSPDGPDGAHCFVNNTDCGACCNFKSCLKYATCENVPCPAAVCEGATNPPVRCPYAFPYTCLTYPNFGGCSPTRNWWPEHGCESCCDFRTCYEQFQCTTCPPELCEATTECPNNAPYMCTASDAGYAGQCAPQAIDWEASAVCQACCSCPGSGGGSSSSGGGN